MTMSPSAAPDHVPTQPQPSWRDHIQPDWPLPQIQNVVATVNLDCRLDLNLIAQHARNVEYKPKRFPALIMRIREPRTTTLVFASGRVVITGAKSEDMARLAARRHARAIQKCGFNTRFRDFTPRNFVGSLACGFHIRLEGIVSEYDNWSCYEPELFPGLVFKMINPAVKALVFTTGKVVFTGAKTEAQVYHAFIYLYPILERFRVADRPPGLLPAV